MNLPLNNPDFVILLVDDRPENLLSLEEILTKPNRKFILAHSGNEALKLVLKNEDIGLIMLDVQMPDMDGFEVARLLKANSKTKDIAIIFVTAISKEDQYVLKGFEEGAVDYLQKPLDINITRAKVNVFERLYFSQYQLMLSLSETERINKQLERFVYLVSHDLKAPLSSIIMLTTMLKKNDKIVEHADLIELVNFIATQSTRLSEMIIAILEYSRTSMSQQVIEEVDVCALVNEIVQALLLPENFKVMVHSELPVMQTRKIKLQQVFQNLISNSVKYNDKETPLIEIGVHDKGSFFEFYIKDNGAGISKKDQSRIFNLFETTQNQSTRESSTGVGLNVLKVLVEEQGGKIGVDSVQGEGSTFYFEWMK